MRYHPGETHNCLHCRDMVMIPVYLGGGYSGVARCTVCDRSREKIKIEKKGQPVIMRHKIAHGLISFYRVMHRNPESYERELEITNREVEKYLDAHGGPAPGAARHARSYG